MYFEVGPIGFSVETILREIRKKGWMMSLAQTGRRQISVTEMKKSRNTHYHM